MWIMLLWTWVCTDLSPCFQFFWVCAFKGNYWIIWKFHVSFFFSMFHFWMKHYNVFHSSCTIWHSLQVCARFTISPHPLQHLLFWYEVVSHCGFEAEVSLSFFWTFYFVLGYSQLTMLWQFQGNSKGTQPYTYVYPGCHIPLSWVPCAVQ